MTQIYSIIAQPLLHTSSCIIFHFLFYLRHVVAPISHNNVLLTAQIDSTLWP